MQHSINCKIVRRTLLWNELRNSSQTEEHNNVLLGNIRYWVSMVDKMFHLVNFRVSQGVQFHEASWLQTRGKPTRQEGRDCFRDCTKAKQQPNVLSIPASSITLNLSYNGLSHRIPHRAHRELRSPRLYVLINVQRLINIKTNLLPHLRYINICEARS